MAAPSDGEKGLGPFLQNQFPLVHFQHHRHVGIVDVVAVPTCPKLLPARFVAVFVKPDLASGIVVSTVGFAAVFLAQALPHQEYVLDVPPCPPQRPDPEHLDWF